MATENLSRHDYVPTSLAIQALRDSGYKNTAYAVAELLDNSIQAGATHVELMCIEAVNTSLQRQRLQISQIAVLDNGNGMDSEVLSRALQFGNGTHLNETKGMGKFGMGLPNSSISQALKAEVWSWQNGKTPLYTYLDIENLGSGEVPTPVLKDLPEIIVSAAQTIGKSGTLVLWSNLDRCIWKTAEAIINNSELLIGRMYRKFLVEGKVTISLLAFDKTNPKQKSIARNAIPNDPGYLITPSSTPKPYDTTPMFKKFGEVDGRYPIKVGEEIHYVDIRYSLVQDSIRRDNVNAGNTPYGQHAAKNEGVSLVREGRELTLDSNLVGPHDVRNRWWGVEIEFPAALDRVFGVTNNKQEARNFDAVAKSFKSMSASEAKEYIRDQAQRGVDEDPSAPLYGLIQQVDRQIDLMKAQVKEVAKRKTGRHGGSAEEIATGVTRDRIKEGHKGASDVEFVLETPESRTAKIAETMVKAGYTEEEARDFAAQTVGTGRRFIFLETQIEGNAFFSVRPVAGEIVIRINSEHNAYKNLVSVLDNESTEDSTKEELARRLDLAREGLRLLLISWARYEDEQPNEELRKRVQDIRIDWGRMAAEYLKSV
jgi:Histidine kinase-, DNA gyrase B-, and HSP90-like ATPase